MENLIGKTLVTVDLVTDEKTKMKILGCNESEHYFVCDNYPSKIYLFDEEQWERVINYKTATIHPDEVECYIKIK